MGDPAPRLIIASFDPLVRAGHWYYEIETFNTQARELGLAVRIVVRRVTDPQFVAALGADPALDILPPLDFTRRNFAARSQEFADAGRLLAPLWAWLDVENPGASDLVYFTSGHPIVIRGIGAWLAARSPGQRPAVFFRIIGEELTDLNTGRFKSRAIFYMQACDDLRTRAGHERVFFLVNANAKARAVAHVCRRRSFMMQHHFGRPAGVMPVPDAANPVAYVHLNGRSGRLAAQFGDIVGRVARRLPSVKFLVRAGPDISAMFAALPREAAAHIEVLPVGQDMTGYIANMERATLVLLAYESQAYKVLTSGVFAEAASLGKPVVVPAGTWMAEKIAEGYGVGRTFDGPDDVAAVLVDALRNSASLGAAAREIAPRLGQETGPRAFLERMLALSRTAPDMTPPGGIGEPIALSDVLDTRGWVSRAKAKLRSVLAPLDLNPR